MKIAGKKPWYLEYLLIIVGTGLMGTAITSCFDAAGMVTGGFSGIAILVKAWTKGLYGNGIPLWITNLILNVPLFLLATKIKGFAFVRKALLGDISLTIWLAILPAWKLSEDFLRQNSFCHVPQYQQYADHEHGNYPFLHISPSPDTSR